MDVSLIAVGGARVLIPDALRTWLDELCAYGITASSKSLRHTQMRGSLSAH